VCITFPAFNLRGTPGNGIWSGQKNGVDIVSKDGRFVPGTPTLGANKLYYTYTSPQGNCVFRDSLVVTVNPNPVVKASYTSVISGRDYDPIDILESAELKATGADSYTWGPAVDLSGTIGSSVFASPRANQVYQVVGTLNGCSASDTVRVKVRTDVRVANGFSPNNDDQNDFWNIYNIQAYPNADIQVFNRWGALVYKAKGSDLQNLADYWNGKSEGKDVPVSTYYYIIDLNNNQKPFTGSITLVR
jgi:gliding motility-associated-like protein